MTLLLLALLTARRGSGDPITLPLVGLDNGHIAVAGKIDGADAVIGLGVEFNNTVVFAGSPQLHGAKAGVVTTLSTGPLSWSGVQVKPVANPVAKNVVKYGLSGSIGADNLKSVQLGFDFESGTVTFWHSLGPKQLSSWVSASREVRDVVELAAPNTQMTFDARPVDVHMLIGGVDHVVDLTTLMGPCGASPQLLASSVAGAAAVPGEWFDHARLVAIGPKRGAQQQLIWFLPVDQPWSNAGFDAIANIAYLGFSRIVIDFPNHKVLYSNPSPCDSFCWWLCQTSNLPIASVDGIAKWSEQKTWASLGADRTKKGDYDILEIGGYPIDQLRKAYESGDSKSAQLMVEFANRLYSKPFTVVVKIGDRTAIHEFDQSK